MSDPRERVDAIIIGAGPAGSAVGRLLASWGHHVAIVAPIRDRARGLVESLPPSARKLLSAVSLLDAVERAGFPPNRGNAVWWGSSDGRVEDFGGGAGFQVFRPDFDAVLLDEAERAGAVVERGAIARAVALDDPEAVTVAIERDGRRSTLAARFVVDCSGRAGVVARRGHREYDPTHRMQAFIGVWQQPTRPAADADDLTIIETYEDGWAWSMAMGGGRRQIAVMVDGATTRTTRGPIEEAYLAELRKTAQVRGLTTAATLERAWACDASMHTSRAFAGPQFLLVGDAAACIDPLSSSGVRKALSSGWLGAIALHTALIDPTRRAVAFDFFAAREREVFAAERARTDGYAARAFAHHGREFWGARASDPSAATPASDIDARLRGDAVRAAFDRLRAATAVRLRWREPERRATQALIRGREIVLEDALMIGGSAVRFADGIDLVRLGDAAGRHGDVPSIYDEYCRTHGEVALPQFLAALSLLVAEGLLDT